jgi:succinate dehydrogenase / fumarate reductase cytochrome b subunit
MMGLRYAYFPGCVAKGSAREVEDAMRAVVKALDIELVDMPGAACCGAGVMKQANHRLQLTLNARTFAQAEAMGLDVLTPCATCQGNMYEDLALLLDDEKLRAEVNDVLEKTCGMRFEGTLRMRHLLQVLVEDVGLGKVSEHVVNPVDFPVAGYYGVPMLQEGASGDDDPMNPRYFEDLLVAIGSAPVHYDGATRSVGFPGLLGRERTAMLQTAEVLSEAKQEGALVMATACPLSHFNLDVYQVKAKKVSGLDTALPVVHLPELVAFALGMMPDRYAQLRTRALVMGA